MQTQFWKVDPAAKQEDLEKGVELAAVLLAKGQVVAFPTETVYGLGAGLPIFTLCFSDFAIIPGGHQMLETPRLWSGYLRPKGGRLTTP